MLDHSTLSPSGRVSKRAQLAAQERTRRELFGPDGLQRPACPQPSRRDVLLRTAAELRELADWGMRPRKYRKEAARLEAEAAHTEE